MSQTTIGRDELTAPLEAGDWHAAAKAARRVLGEDPTVRDLRLVRAAVAASDTAELGLKPFRLALLSSFSIELIHDAVQVQSFLSRLDTTIYQSGFQQYTQEILDPASGLYGFEPDVVVLALEGRDVLPSLYGGFVRGGGSGAEAMCDTLGELLETFRSRSPASVLVHDFARPVPAALGILDAQTAGGQIEEIERLNRRLAEIVRGVSGAYRVDYSGLVARFGARSWYDARMFHYARAPIAQPMMSHLAAEYMKYVRALRGLAKKCLVVDLDNTLWGGVLGEDGVDGVQLGPRYPGSAYQEFQNTLKSLTQRGIMLAIASKNNEPDVDEMMDGHRHMVLTRDDFVAREIHWRPKSESIRALADDLNIGLGHMAFADDSAFECAEVADALPEVAVLHLSGPPEGFSDQVLSSGLFDVVSVTDEDAQRAELYRRRAAGERLRRSAGSLEDFYRDLDLTVYVRPVDASNLSRSAQLTQKTNQFNATTRRYTEADVEAFVEDAGWVCRAVSVVDRFGDHGVVGLVLAQEDGGELVIDTLLLSCRVIGRTVETAMLSYLFHEAAKRQKDRVAGTIIDTKKNVPVRDLYQRHGFERVASSDGESRWRLAVDVGVPCPEWIHLEVE